MKQLFVLTIAAILFAGSTAYALKDWSHQKTPTEFYSGHIHVEDITGGAPQHSGGTDRYGCHNGSVPYHCH